VARSGRDALALPDGRSVAMLRLDRPVATAIGERFVLRRPSPAGLLAGGVVLDRIHHEVARAAARPQRRRDWRERSDEVAKALLDLHGYLPARNGSAPDVRATAVDTMVSAVRTHHSEHPAEPGLPVSAMRILAATSLRSLVSIARQEATSVASSLIDELVLDGRLVRHDEHVCMPEFRRRPARAWDGDGRLVTLLDATMPPPLAPPRLRPAARRRGSWAPGAHRRRTKTWPGRAGMGATADQAVSWPGQPLTPAALRDDRQPRVRHGPARRP
jgi:hypothetical protein